jgi:hypothetical protein
MQKKNLMYVSFGVTLLSLLIAADAPDEFERLREMGQSFGNPQILNTQPESAIELIKQMAPAKAERQRLATKYAEALKQKSRDADQKNRVLRYFDGQFGNFEKAVNDFAAAAPEQINKDVDDALKMGQEAVANKRPLYFGEKGGVRQHLTWAQTRCNVLAAIAPDSADTAAAKKKIEAANEQVKQMKASLNDAIIGSNTVPTDQYKGADKAQLVELVKSKWKESGVAGDVLKSGINSRDWTRDTYWRFNGTDTFNKEDKSKLQGFVVVKTDDKLATVHYINLVKDHLASDQVTTYFFEDPKAEADVSRKILLKSIK